MAQGVACGHAHSEVTLKSSGTQCKPIGTQGRSIGTQGWSINNKLNEKSGCTPTPVSLHSTFGLSRVFFKDEGSRTAQERVRGPSFVNTESLAESGTGRPETAKQVLRAPAASAGQIRAAGI